MTAKLKTAHISRPLPGQIQDLIARINAANGRSPIVAKRGPKNGYVNRSQLPEALTCESCFIGIFVDEKEAARHAVPFTPAINRRVGKLCIGCAGLDSVGLDRVGDIIPAAQPEPRAEDGPSAAVLAAHADYLATGDRIVDVAARHGISGLGAFFRTHGLKRRKQGQGKRKRKAKEATPAKRQPQKK